VAGIEQQLADHDIIGLDTSVFIYHLEAHPRYLPVTTQLLNGVYAGHRQAVISTAALMELTVHPWRSNRSDVARQYEALLVNFPHLRLVDVTRDVARQAAQLRAGFNLRPADALQVATALVCQATAVITNDKQLSCVEPLLAVMLLDDFDRPGNC
jgi:predicted nucleic acid-binding protein